MFPRLARDMPEIQAAASDMKQGLISEDEYEKAESMQRNRLSNMALCISAVGEVYHHPIYFKLGYYPGHCCRDNQRHRKDCIKQLHTCGSRCIRYSVLGSTCDTLVLL